MACCEGSSVSEGAGKDVSAAGGWDCKGDC